MAEPRVQYAKTEDGVSIAYWTLGDGNATLPERWFGGHGVGICEAKGFEEAVRVYEVGWRQAT